MNNVLFSQDVFDFLNEKCPIGFIPRAATFKKTGRNDAIVEVTSTTGGRVKFTISRLFALPSAVLKIVWGDTWFSQEELWGDQPEDAGNNDINDRYPQFE
jgi:hypothetical protein